MPYIEDGTITGSVVQKSYVEAYLGVHLLHRLNNNAMKMVKDAKGADINPLSENVNTGVGRLTKDNIDQFKSA